MPRYIIERSAPGVGKSSVTDMQNMAVKSNGVLRELGPDVQWVQSYVGADKIFCVYNAKNPEIVREHARLAGFPCDTITEVATILDPISGERTIRA